MRTRASCTLGTGCPAELRPNSRLKITLVHRPLCPPGPRGQHSPVLHGVEGLLVGDVVHQDETHGPPVIGGGDGPVPLLPCCVLGTKSPWSERLRGEPCSETVPSRSSEARRGSVRCQRTEKAGWVTSVLRTLALRVTSLAERSTILSTNTCWVLTHTFRVTPNTGPWKDTAFNKTGPEPETGETQDVPLMERGSSRPGTQ
jgi:hypothetical protein